MPRIPTFVDLGGGDPRASYPVPNIPDIRAPVGSPVGAAIAGLGDALAGLGGVLAKQNRAAIEQARQEREQAERHGTTVRFLRFEQQQREYLEQLKQSAQPGAVGFTDNFVTQYDSAARELFADIPDRLKGEFDLRLFRLRQDFATPGSPGGARQYEDVAARKYAIESIGSGANVLINKAILNADALGEAQGQLKDLIATNPTLSPVEKDDQYRSLSRVLQAKWFEAHPNEGRDLFESANVPRETVAFWRERWRGGANPNFNLDPEFDARLRAAIADAEKATGAKAQIRSLARSTAEQTRLYRRYRSGQGGLAAPPGKSRHERGQAADIDDGPVLNWLHRNAGQYGLEFLKGKAFSQDTGHIQMNRSDSRRTAAPSATEQPVVVPPELDALTPNDLSAIVAGAERQEKATLTAMAAERKDALDLGIETGVVTSADTILDEPLLDDGEKAVLLRRFSDRRAQNDTAASVLSKLADADANKPAIFDPTAGSDDRKGLDRVYRDLVPDGALAAGDNKAASTAFGLWRRTAIMPKRMEGELIAGLRSSDVPTVTTVLAYLDALEREEPAAFNREANAEIKNAVAVHRAMRDYYNPQEIADRLVMAGDPKKEQMAVQILATHKEAIEDIDIADISDMFDPGWFSSEPGIPHDERQQLAMVAEFKELLRDRLADGSSFANARKEAAERLKLRWGPSAANGGRLMKFPPEQYYRTIDGSYDWLVADIERTLEGAGVRPQAVLEGFSAWTPAYGIVATPQANTEIMRGQPISYYVIYEDDDGAMNMLLDKQGRPLAMAFDREKYAADAATLARSRRERQIGREGTARKAMEELAGQMEQSIPLPTEPAP